MRMCRARSLCSHVAILPEAATILFSGGFPRLSTLAGQRATQRAIFRVQRELERLAIEDGGFAIILCDRGTLDGLAYWPGGPEDFWKDLGAGKEHELARYHAVLHLQSPAENYGYNHRNAVRVETPDEAHIIDLRILSIWAGHPRREVVPPAGHFPEKALCALEFLRAQMPACCQPHPLATA